MKAPEFIDHFFATQTQLGDPRQFRLFTRILLHKIADVSHSLRLADGQSLNDGLDFSSILRELAEAAVLFQEARPATRFDHTCSDCGHVHEDKAECKVYLGEGRFCPCESKVAA